MLADPDALSYQYVVECKRRAQVGNGAPDVLAPIEFDWPGHSCAAIELELTALREHATSVEAELAAWENSTVARLTKPMRAASGRLRRAVAARRS